MAASSPCATGTRTPNRPRRPIEAGPLVCTVCHEPMHCYLTLVHEGRVQAHRYACYRCGRDRTVREVSPPAEAAGVTDVPEGELPLVLIGQGALQTAVMPSDL